MLRINKTIFNLFFRGKEVYKSIIIISQTFLLQLTKIQLLPSVDFVRFFIIWAISYCILLFYYTGCEVEQWLTDAITLVSLRTKISYHFKMQKGIEMLKSRWLYFPLLLYHDARTNSECPNVMYHFKGISSHWEINYQVKHWFVCRRHMQRPL